jgi:uncharacterized membrane protein
MVTLRDFLDYFLNPTKSGYTLPKTLTYASVLVIFTLVLFEMLKKLRIKVDRKLCIALSPYILFGSVVRVMEDVGMLSSSLFVTPGIFFFTFSVIASAFAISLVLQRGLKLFFIIGVVLFGLSISFLSPVNFYGMVLVLVFFAPWLLIFWLIRGWAVENRIVSSIQLFDGTTTFVALSFFGGRFVEQHLLAGALIGLFGPLSFLFTKLLVIVAVLLLIDKLSKDRQFNSYLKLMIAILGGATAFRDFLLLSVI